MEYERWRGRPTAGGECEERGGGDRFVRHRQRRLRRQGRAVLGLCRHSARLGCVEDAGKRHQDILIVARHRGTAMVVPRPIRGTSAAAACPLNAYPDDIICLASGMPRITVRELK